MIAMAIYITTFFIGMYLLVKKKTDQKVAVILLAGSLAAAFLEIMFLTGDHKSTMTEMIREEKSGTKKTVELEVEAEGEKGTVQVEIFPQEYSQIELEKLSEIMWENLEKEIPGQNNTVDYVTEDLFFPERVESFPFVIKWVSSEKDLLSSDGKVGEEIPQEGALVKIQADISVERGTYKQERIFYVKLYPSKDREKFWKRLERKLKQLETESREQISYFLPEQFEGKEIRFYNRKKKISGTVFLMSILAGVLLVLAQQEEIEKKKKARATSIEREYPKMVMRMTMLAGTGMTISGAFHKIAAGYQKRKNKKTIMLYEEMLITCREMEAGIPERTAYQNMGLRCGLPCIVRFTALLVQYMQSGAGGLKRALKNETDQALQERKERAKRCGEEAGTKLLLPMTFLLILIMIIIVIPAFSSFGV